MAIKNKREKTAGKPDIKGKKILIVEDDALLAGMYKDKFIKEGFQISVAEDPEKGLEIAKKENPDLIILDIVMPKGGGVEFLKRKQENPSILPIPTVVFSNYDYLTIQKQVEKLGAKDYLIKSNYTPSQLLEKIKNFLK